MQINVNKSKVELEVATLLIRFSTNLLEENKAKWKVFSVINNSKVFLKELVSLNNNVNLSKLLLL